MTGRVQVPPTDRPWVPLLAFATAISAVGWFACAYAPRQTHEALDDVGRSLETRADARLRALESWLESGIADAKTVARFPSTRHLAAGSRDASIDPEFRAILEDFGSLHGFEAILVLDRSSRILARAGAWAGDPGPLAPPGVDFFRTDDGAPRIRFAVPIDAGSGVVVLVADPARHVYPTLRFQPLTYASSEAFLLRRERDRIVYLSPMAQRPDAALAFSRPIDGSGLEGLEVAGGPARGGSYRDHRGETVLAATRRLRSAPWSLVVKVDRDEVLAPVRQHLLTEGAGGAAFLAVALALVTYAWRIQTRKAGAALARSRHRMVELLDHAGDAILVVDAKGSILEVNRAAERMYARPRAAIEGTSARSLLAEKDRNAVVAKLAAVLETGGALAEAVQVRGGGEEFPTEISLRRVDEPGGPLVLAIVRDISARKEVERRLLLLNSRVRTLFEVDQLLVHERDRTRLLSTACRILVEHGGFASAWVGFADSTSEDGALLAFCRAGSDAPDGNPRTAAAAIRERRIVVDGHEAAFPVGDRGVLVIRTARGEDLDPETLSLLGQAAGDLTFGLDGIRRLERLEGILSASPSPIMTLDREANVTYGNPACETVVGWSRTEAVDGPLPFDEPDRTEGFAPYFARALSGESLIAVEVRRSRSDGTPVDLLLSTAPVRDDTGRIDGVVAILTDVTERKRAEEDLRRLNQELEQRVRDRTAALESANDELEAFSYSVSHDLRSPLRGIDGFARMIEEDHASRLDEEGRRLLAVVRNSAKEMGQLIDDLLLFSKAQRHEIRRARVDMAALARAVALELVPDPEAAEVDLRIGPLPDAHADSALLRQVFRNLLSNALKFSASRGRRTIEVSAETTGDEVVYSVRDDGAGFDPKYAGKLFRAFQRLHGSREFEGSGIGLAIVQRIVRRHGGRVFAEGQPGGGARFGFSLPAAEGRR